ncbi:MAG: hypothetical protein OEY59_13990, partial [Deltaproteobacteria bacterium]|nr:hypothetical protein [Deltaproteobacteria bacterium]
MTAGSKWRKWDLHLHTPSSYDYHDKSISNQEIIDNLYANKVEAVAITDHHVIDIERIKELQKLGKDKVSVLPGIEFRAELGGSESVHFIGIFPEDSDIEHIWINLQSKCQLTVKAVADQGGDEKIHCDLKDTCRLIHELGGIVSVHAGAKTNTIENITNTLPYKMALKTDLVLNHIDILELGTEADQDDYKNIVFPAINHQLPMVICTDNHNIKDYIFKQNCWIKSDPTFEGLKQIIFEPTFRIHIAESPPIDPPIRINTVSFVFSATATFEDELFCLAGKKDIVLSPNFTCFIGGRGSGKSTILNLIHEKLRPSENAFFKNKKIKDADGKPIVIGDNVCIDGDTDEKYIEFLSQNEVEEFAQDYHKLTTSVYSRITKRDEEGLIVKYEEYLNTQLDLLKEHILDKIKIIELTTELSQSRKELGANKKIIESFSSDEYLKINSDLKAITEELNSIKKSQTKYNELIKEANGIIKKFDHNDQTNIYGKQIEYIIHGIKELLAQSLTVDFQESESDKATLEEKLTVRRSDLKRYLTDKGLTEENQKDIANANISTTIIEQKISEKNEEIFALQSKIDSFDFEILQNASTDYESEIKKQIKLVSDVLEKLESKSVKPISLFFDFDITKANEEVFSDFKIAFEGKISGSNHKGDNILKEILFCIPPNELTDHPTFFQKISDYRTSSAAKAFLLELFSDRSNFDIYKLLATLNFLD